MESRIRPEIGQCRKRECADSKSANRPIVKKRSRSKAQKQPSNHTGGKQPIQPIKSLCLFKNQSYDAVDGFRLVTQIELSDEKWMMRDRGKKHSARDIVMKASFVGVGPGRSIAERSVVWARGQGQKMNLIKIMKRFVVAAGITVRRLSRLRTAVQFQFIVKPQH